MFDLLVFVGAICLLFGVAYPVCAIIAYPFYKYFGGRDSFREYIKNL